MFLEQALILQNPKAVNMAKTLTEMPALMSTNPPFFIPLELTGYGKDGNAEIAERPVIVSGQAKKKQVTDNVAPGTWEWTLEGYIPGLSAIELTNLYTPFVILNRALLETAFKNGTPITFKDRDCVIYKSEVVIKSLHLGMEAEVANKTPFTMTLKQIVTLNLANETLDTIEASAIPQEGLTAGNEAGMGSVATDQAGETMLYKTMEFAGIIK